MKGAQRMSQRREPGPATRGSSVQSIGGVGQSSLVGPNHVSLYSGGSFKSVISDGD